MQKKTLRTPWPGWSRIPSFVLLALTVAFIFSNSMETAAESTVKSSAVLGGLELLLQQLPPWFTEVFLRKLGHFAEYSLVGGVLFCCLRSCTVRLWAHGTKAVLGGVLIALTDETIQLFVEGRSGQITDVWLDSAGVLFGLLCVGCLVWLIELQLAHRRSKTGGNL